MGGFQGLGDSYHHPEKNKNSMSYEMIREKKNQKQREYHQKNKEYDRAYKKEWYQKNKQIMKEWYQNNKEYVKKQKREYYKINSEKQNKKHKEWEQSPEGKKSRKIATWKQSGLKLFGYTYEEVYEYYLSIDNCEVCNKDISGYNKHMDHCHDTGIFRWVLCNSCNNHDNWMNKI
tara:strand:- start:113 stop:637 length:525 start_codon:yes stop_codon:yes gene_type:complete